MREDRIDRRRYLRLAGAAGVGATTTLAGCTGDGNGDGGGEGGDGGDGDTSTPGSTEDGDVPELTVAPAPGTANVIFQVIEDEGLDEEHGVSLNIEMMDPNSGAQAVVNRQVPTSFLSVLATARANAQDNQLRQLWPMFTNNESCVVRSDADVSTDSLGSTLEDLQGLTLGMLPETSTLYSIFHLLLIEHGLDIDQYDIRTGPPPVITGLAQDGEIDGMIMIAPLPSKLVATGEFERVFNYDAAWREVTGNSVSQIEAAAHQDTIEENREAFRGYFEAYHEAQAIIAEDPEEYLGRYADDIGVNDEELQILVEHAREINWFRPEYAQELRDGDVQLAEMAYEEGLLEEDPNVDEMFIDPREL